MAAKLSNVRVSGSCTLVALLVIGCGARQSAAGAGDTVILVVRHAERTSNAPNSDLSADGMARANALAAAASPFAIAAVYTTDFCRTAQTGQPTAVAAGTGLRVLSTGSSAAGLDGCTPAITVSHDDWGGAADAAARIIAAHPGGAALVVGHSNTVPDMVAALTGQSPCPALIAPDERQRCMLPETAYGDLYVVRIPAAGDAIVTHRRFGS
jgi:phosphohistidine phosphatase SixA